MKNVNVIFQQWRIYNSKLLIAAIYSLVQTYKNTHTHNPTRVCFHEHRLRPFWNKQNPIYIQWWQYAFSMWKSSTKHLLCHNPHSIHLPIATIVNVYTICRNINEQQDNQNNDDQKKKTKKMTAQMYILQQPTIEKRNKCRTWKYQVHNLWYIYVLWGPFHSTKHNDTRTWTRSFEWINELLTFDFHRAISISKALVHTFYSVFLDSLC